MMSRSRLELLGLQTLLSGLEFAAAQANDSVSQARSALELAQKEHDAAANGHFIDVQNVAAATRGRPPKALAQAAVLLPAPREHQTKRNWKLLRAAGIKPKNPGAPSRDDVKRAEKILARREKVTPLVASDTAHGNAVRARYDLLKQAGIKPSGKAPSRTEMEEARRVIAARGEQPIGYVKDKRGRNRPIIHRHLTAEQKNGVGASSRDRWQRAIQAGIDTKGKIPNKEHIAAANAVLARLCSEAGVAIKADIPTLSEALKAKRVLKKRSEAAHAA